MTASPRSAPRPRRAERALLLVALSCAAPAASACAAAQVQSTLHVLDTRANRARPSTYQALPLETGQIILSEADSPYSTLFALGPERFFRFTHAALLVFEGGEPWVYDMSGEYTPGCVDRPTDAIEGGMRRQPFDQYCRANLYVEIYDPPPGVDRDRLVAHLQDLFARDVPFDAYFRNDDTENLYCTQMVELALVASGAPPTALVPVRQNPSLLKLLEWFRVPGDLSRPAGAYADPARYMGALGRFKTRTAAHAYFAAKREVHRRFTHDQRLGNVFIMRGTSELELRPEVVTFMNQAIRLFEVSRFAPEPSAIDADVRALADRLFGPA